MNLEAQIAESLFERVASLPTTLPVSYPGIEFDPPANGDPWIEARLFPGETNDYGWDRGIDFEGLLQLGVTYRPGVGIIKPMDIAGDIITHFAKGTQMGIVRTYRRPWVGSIVEEQDRLKLPVTIPYRGFYHGTE